uniref:PhoP/PhoQ regulator MgrB n=1 Tax=Steinernema glaseri TaxID=37863 RepID=A0A1I7ZBC0_9BILA
MRNMRPVTMLWKVSLLLAVYLLAWAVWRCNDDFIERTTEQPQFHINDY